MRLLWDFVGSNPTGCRFHFGFGINSLSLKILFVKNEVFNNQNEKSSCFYDFVVKNKVFISKTLFLTTEQTKLCFWKRLCSTASGRQTKDSLLKTKFLTTNKSILYILFYLFLCHYITNSLCGGMVDVPVLGTGVHKTCRFESDQRQLIKNNFFLVLSLCCSFSLLKTKFLTTK